MNAAKHFDDQVEKLIRGAEILAEENTTLRTRLAEVEADAARWKSKSEQLESELEDHHETRRKTEQIHQSLLERLKEAEWLLRDAANEHKHRVTPEWLQLRDAFLNPSNKDVK